jgi:pyrroline-5-carboxylate reductase
MTIAPLSPDNPILLFGCGNMGRALLEGWLAGGFDPACFVVIDPVAAGLPVTIHRDATSVTRTFSLALLGVKPQLFAEVAPVFESLLAPDATMISILAGTRIATLQQAFAGRAIIRLMPNLAAALGKSPLGLYPQVEGLNDLLAPLGTPFWLSSEAQMDAVTALAGSGPAFVYRFIDALAGAGENLGLDANQALGLATAMVEGAALLVASSDAPPQILARRVTSPGGTTAAGLAVLDDNAALAKLIEATLTAARDRGVELSKS